MAKNGTSPEERVGAGAPRLDAGPSRAEGEEGSGAVKKYRYIVIASTIAKNKGWRQSSPVTGNESVRRKALVHAANEDRRVFMTHDEATLEASKRHARFSLSRTYKVYRVERVS